MVSGSPPRIVIISNVINEYAVKMKQMVPPIQKIVLVEESFELKSFIVVIIVY